MEEKHPLFKGLLVRATRRSSFGSSSHFNLRRRSPLTAKLNLLDFYFCLQTIFLRFP
jgi:hypothetical protein